MGSMPQFLSAVASSLPSKMQTSPKAMADRNVQNVVLGDIFFKTWYPSFYPEELVGRDTERLYVCRWCFKYSKEVMPFSAHVKACPLKDVSPPGTLIYTKDAYSIYEVDGEEHKLFTQNLSLFAKLFLDNKSVFFDVASFNYYLLVHHHPSHPHTPSSSPHQVIGFFSKEKMSWDNNNLACILIFPPWQRKGLGKILMGVSYELSKREGRLGGPEKPLSELGKKGYLGFWETRVARAILETKAKTTMSVSDIAEACWMLPEDVLFTLKEMAIVGPKKRADGSAVVSKGRLREWIRTNGLDLTPPISEEGFLEKLAPEHMEDVES